MSELVKKEKAPSVIIDPTVLGDRLPRDKDSIAQKIEDTQNFRNQHHKVEGQDFLTNKESAAVNYMDPIVFIRRVQKLNAGLLFGWGAPGCCCPYIQALDDDPYSPTFGQFTAVLIPASGFRLDAPMPEFSWLETDNWGIATREGERGWRTVLIRFIKAGFLKYPAVKAEFGEPLGERGKLWHQQLREYKI